MNIKKLSLILFLSTFSLTLAGDIEDVLKTYEAMDKAFVDEKPKELFKNIHNDNTVFWGDKGWLGNYGTVKGWTEGYLKNDYTWTVRDREGKVYGNTAVVATIATQTETSDKSETKIYQVRETAVLSKIKNKWTLVHMHLSEFEPKNDD